MNQERNDPSAPTTRDEFEAALCALVCGAHANDVDVRGAANVCFAPETGPDWTIEITHWIGVAQQ